MLQLARLPRASARRDLELELRPVLAERRGSDIQRSGLRIRRRLVDDGRGIPWRWGRREHLRHPKPKRSEIATRPSSRGAPRGLPGGSTAPEPRRWLACTLPASAPPRTGGAPLAAACSPPRPRSAHSASPRPRPPAHSCRPVLRHPRRDRPRVRGRLQLPDTSTWTACTAPTRGLRPGQRARTLRSCSCSTAGSGTGEQSPQELGLARGG